MQYLVEHTWQSRHSPLGWCIPSSPNQGHAAHLYASVYLISSCGLHCCMLQCVLQLNEPVFRHVCAGQEILCVVTGRLGVISIWDHTPMLSTKERHHLIHNFESFVIPCVPWEFTRSKSSQIQLSGHRSALRITDDPRYEAAIMKLHLEEIKIMEFASCLIYKIIPRAICTMTGPVSSNFCHITGDVLPILVSVATRIL